MENWKPSYGKKEFKKKNRYEMKDGDVVFRILPQPKGDNAERSGSWSKYYSIVWGYKNTEGKARPFESCLVKRNKMVEVPDPAVERFNDLKAKLEQARQDKNEPLTVKLNTLVGFKGVYNVDNNHYMNVIGLDGEIGLLKLRYTAKQALDVEIDKLRATGIDPLGFDSGRFFVFSRSGKNRDTAFKVNVYSEQVDAVTSRQVVHKVTAEILSKLESDGFDLETEIAPKLTFEEVKQVVAESDLLTGKSPAIDRFIDARRKAQRAAPTQDSEREEPQYEAPPTQAPPLRDSVTAPPVTANASTSVDELSDDDFFKQIGVQTG